MKLKSLVVALALAGTCGGVGAWEALPASAPVPADNPMSEAKVELGKMLFMDPRFSSTGTVSCNSCHNVMEGGDDDRPVSMGIHGATGGRNAPTVWNAAFSSTQFWDGRAPSLEEQAKGPVTNPVEMGMADLEKAMQRVRAIPGYAERFARVFGGEDPVTADNAAKAVAAFERTLITPDSPYDRYVKGDEKALTAQQVRGMQTFAEVGCTACHSGPAFNGPTLPQGQGNFMKFPTFPAHAVVKQFDLAADEGRQQVTHQPSDAHLFKVPTLRNIAMTAPYFHNGKVSELDEAVRVMGRVQLDRELSDAQVADLVAFLEGLTGEFPAITMPRLPAALGSTVLSSN